MKRRHKYQLSVNDESRLCTVFRMRLTALRATAMFLVVLVLASAIAVAVIMLTPLRTLLPGYMKEAQRTDAVSTMMIVDSLQMRYNQNQAYLDNLMRIMDTDRSPNDSADLTKPDIITDTLMVAAAGERAFVREMEEREKFNISISAPLAAEGMIFAMPAQGAIVSADTQKKNTATVILPRGEGIDAVSDGTVVDKHYDLKSRTFTIVLQHAKGFMSHYSHLGLPVVDLGEHVMAGQQIAQQASGGVASSETIYLQIWRNGLPLVTADYMREYKARSTESTDVVAPEADRVSAGKDKARIDAQVRQRQAAKQTEQ